MIISPFDRERKGGNEAKHEIAWCKSVRTLFRHAFRIQRGQIQIHSWILHISLDYLSQSCLDLLATACVAMEALEKFCDVLIHRRRLLDSEFGFIYWHIDII